MASEGQPLSHPDYVVLAKKDYVEGVQPILIGTILSFGLFGISLFQLGLCFTHLTWRSNWITTSLLVALVAVDVGDSVGKGIFICDWYGKLVLEGASFLGLPDQLPGSIFAVAFTDGVTASLVHLIYLRRLVRVTPAPDRGPITWMTVALCGGLSVVQLVGCILTGLHALQFPIVIMYSTIWMASAAIADVLVCTALMHRFWLFKPVFKDTKDLVKKFMVVTAEAGVIPAVMQVLNLVMLLAYKKQAYHFVFATLLPKIYTITAAYLLRTALLQRERSDIHVNSHTDFRSTKDRKHDSAVRSPGKRATALPPLNTKSQTSSGGGSLKDGVLISKTIEHRTEQIELTKREQEEEKGLSYWGSQC